MIKEGMTFPILFGSEFSKRLLAENPFWRTSVPFAMVAQHEGRVLGFYGHYVEQMAMAGGITPQGLVAVLDGVSPRETEAMSYRDAMKRIEEHVMDFERAQQAEEVARQASTENDD